MNHLIRLSFYGLLLITLSQCRQNSGPDLVNSTPTLDDNVAMDNPDGAIEYAFTETQRQLNRVDISLSRVRICT